MKRTPAPSGPSPQDIDIDALYGLEPVIGISEDAGSDALEQFVDVGCPYCAEQIPVLLDLSAGDQVYVEDCQVCCQPIQIGVTLSDNGSLDAVTAERMDR